MLVKTNISAAGANFSFNAGTQFEWGDLKALIGNGAENFCSPVDPDVEWPPKFETVVESGPPAEAPAEASVAEDPAETVVESEPPAEPKRKRRA